MLDIFSGLRLVVKRRSISIDNAIFRCHWFFTSTLLVSFSLIITARQYVGQPIECHSVNKIPDSLLNSYCWVQSTFTVPQACNKQVGFEVPYPCIDNTRGREIKMFAYYQWVGIALFVQGLLFHLPYYLWKVWENGLIRAITGGLRVAVLNDQDRSKKKDIVVEYIHNHLGCHKRYALKYFLCEFICLINLLLQLWATNKFFDGQFLRYGIDVMHYSSSSISGQFGGGAPSSASAAATKLIDSANNKTRPSSTVIPSQYQQMIAQSIRRQEESSSFGTDQVDPMLFIFPRITKCTYYDFGSSGDVQKHDALCLLPLNIINEKIYIALWFWFIILALLTILVIIYRLFAIVSESVRCKGLISRCKLSNEQDIRIICRHCDVGDWFLFYMIAENLDPLIMREIIADIAYKIRKHFETKRDLGVELDDSIEQDSIYKCARRESFRQPKTNRLTSFDYSDETSLLSRRNSLAANGGQLCCDSQLPMLKRVKKKLYNKRLWSMDLSGANDVRQHLFAQQPATNPENSIRESTIEEQTLIGSAPPASQMPLNSVPPILSARRGSLSRTGSTSSSASTASTFVLEMQTISGSRQQREELPRQQQSSYISHLHHRRLSSHGSNNLTRPKLVRQGSLNRSLRELRLQPTSIGSDGIDNQDEIEILESV